MRLIVILSLTILCSCSTLKQAGRQPASIRQFAAFIDAAHVETTNDLNAFSCEGLLKNFNNRLAGMPSSSIFPNRKEENAEFLAEAKPMIDRLFRLRLLIHEKFESFHEPSPKCVSEIRSAFRALRFSEDMIADWLYVSTFEKAPPSTNFSGENPQTLVNPAFGKVEYKAGDLFIVRGIVFMSAVIARSSDEPSQFSHLAIVGKGADNRLWIAEAIPDKGSVVAPLDEWLQTRHGRNVLIRHKDSTLAEQAGNAIVSLVAKRMNKKDNIAYDYKMDPDNRDQLFCAELIAYAFDLASKGQVKLPKYLSTFAKMKNNNLLVNVGITVPETFAPGDLEVDPRFQIVAEWRDLTETRSSRLLDAVTTSFFDWMTRLNYDLETNPIANMGGAIAKQLRHLGMFADRIQPHAPTSMLQAYLKLDMVIGSMEDHLFALERKHFRDLGYSMSYPELLQELENFRFDDCETYQKWHKWHLQPAKVRQGHPPRAPRFHVFFNTKNGKCNP